MAQRSRPRHRIEDGERGTTDAERRADESATVHLPGSETFSVLRNVRRRAVITHLARTTEIASVNEISRAVAATEHDIPPEHVTDRQHKCVYVSLLQVHLPALVEKSVIEWDESRGRVEGKRSIGTLAALIDLVGRACDSEAN